MNHERVALVGHRVELHRTTGELRRNRKQFSDRKPNFETRIDDSDWMTRQRFQFGHDEELLVGEGRLEAELPRNAQEFGPDDERFGGLEVNRFGQKTPKSFSVVFDGVVASEADASVSGCRSSDEEGDRNVSGFRNFGDFFDGRRCCEGELVGVVRRGHRGGRIRSFEIENESGRVRDCRVARFDLKKSYNSCKNSCK